jgi:HD-GYP domain-containing protein (c-di-GMP phosphodiesterase class II)
MLDQVGGTLHDVGEVVRSSHEHYDGGGYPDGLRADEIPLPARVVSVADAYSAMTTRRIYRDALTPQVAISELRVNAGSQFDPVVVEAALAVLTRDRGDAISLTNGADAA